MGREREGFILKTKTPKRGRPPISAKGNTTPQRIWIRADQMKRLRARAKKQGYKNPSRYIAEWVETGCEGVWDFEPS